MPRISLSNQLVGLVARLAVCFSAAAIAGLATSEAGSYYLGLTRPAWAPPPWVFAPVWSLLYLLMGISAWLVWRDHGFRFAGAALTLFLSQLSMNVLWTWIFFAWHQGELAFAQSLFLWLLILGTVIAFWRKHSFAGILLLPYMVWVGYASALTYAIWQKNPQMLG